MEKLVSIIVPCYNQAQYLNQSLESVLDQTYLNWECIIVNDGSDDNTEEISRKWLEKDKRFKYVFQENEGLSSARNLGVSSSSGELILPLDADDKISKMYVLLAVDAFEKDNTLKLVYCKAEKFGDEQGKWDLPSFSLFKLSRNNLIFCTAFFKKEDWKSAGGYDTKMKFGLEDWEFWITILKNGGNVICLDEIGFYYRIRKNSMLRSLSVERETDNFNYLSIKHADFFVKYYGSFKSMENQLLNLKRENDQNLKSEKFVIDVFFKRFFGFTLFGKYK